MFYHKITSNLSGLLVMVLIIAGCSEKKPEWNDIKDLADNQDVANYMRSFEGRGALSDNSEPTVPESALEEFQLAEDLVMDLVLSEPDIHQPLELNFDHRGRLWVVQYNQYPYPQGLKVTGIDNHLRVEFDKIPAPPPAGTSGADKITVFEDTNGDGTFDKSTDVITGLNITTGVTLGRGHIWVLNPPYLLAYPDKEGNGLPDGPPVVHLEGFGLEDTHAVANSLRWGPDGWLYGATGSTVTSNISSSVTKNFRFDGQGIWRYHPETETFELFAEGGGNTFHVEMDAKGRIYSGDNGAQTRGQYYKQGAYYIKNWGKHGALTNPYAFGYLKNMDLEGDKVRFTHAWIKYEGGELPDRYQDRMISINPLLNYVQLSEFISDGSTFRNIDQQRVVETNDHWFRPVDIKAGPDGAVYLADWYDSRLSHVDPRDTWHKTSGRIYRLRGKNIAPVALFDLSSYSNEQLIELLDHPNKWFRQQALRQFGDRKDVSVVSQLRNNLINETGQLALECLWAINLSGGFNDKMAEIGLTHSDPFVRMWSVRLLGDSKKVSTNISKVLLNMAATESHPEVRSQLACTAKRLPAEEAIPIIKGLISNKDDATDPDNPLLIWWALESKLDNDNDLILTLFEDEMVWDKPIIKQTILERLVQRLVMTGGKENFMTCKRLFHLMPSDESAQLLINGLQEGLRGIDIAELPADLVDVVKPYLLEYGNGALTLAIRQGDADAIKESLMIITNNRENINDRLVYVQIMGELRIPQSVPVLLSIVENNQTKVSVRQAALFALSYFDDDQIGVRVSKAYPDKLRADPDLRMAAMNLFASRAPWAHALLNLIQNRKQVSRDDVPLQIVRQLQLLNDPGVIEYVDRLWPDVQPVSSTDKKDSMKKAVSALTSGSGNQLSGKVLYNNLCGSCHKLFNEGGTMGPDLTGYDRKNINYLVLNIIDPNADIREGYVNYKVIKNDGGTMMGTIVDRSGESITFRSFTGKESVIHNDHIQTLEAQQSSLMPERLLDNLTDQQLRDLFAYISTTDKP